MSEQNKMPLVDENGNVYLEYNDIHMDPANVTSPIIFIPRQDMPSLPYQYKEINNTPAMDNMKSYMTIVCHSYDSYINFYRLCADECLAFIKQNAAVIYTSGILNLLQRFALDNDYILLFNSTHEKFIDEISSTAYSLMSNFAEGLLDKKMSSDYFIYKVAEFKAMFSRKENDFLNHILTTIFSNKMIDTYGFACYIASISSINIDDDLGFNQGTALAFALTGVTDFTKYDAGKISEAVEVNFVNFYYRCIDMINKYNIHKESGPVAKRVDVINEDLMKEIEEDDIIESEELL